MSHLEPLQAVAAFRLLTDNVEHRVDELRTLSVMSLCPIVPGTGLAEHEVVWPEELAEGARANRVHGARLQIHEDRARHVAAARGLVVVHVDALELQVRVAVVRAGRVNAVLVRDDLPELGTDLVTALATLDSNDLTHDFWLF